MLLTMASDVFVKTRSTKRFGENPPGCWNTMEIRYPYARSSMCLVLGFRADESAVPFLMAQVEEMERKWPRDSFAQGPLLALYEMRARFG